MWVSYELQCTWGNKETVKEANKYYVCVTDIDWLMNGKQRRIYWSSWAVGMKLVWPESGEEGKQR